MARLAACSLAVLFCISVGFEWGDLLGGGASSGRKHATEELDGHSFETFIEEHPVVAVLFYAPWCFYSQQMMPAWDLAGQKMQIHDPPVAVVKIDAHRYTNIGDKYGINAFPTMKLFVDGAVFEFDQQGRGWQQVVKWINHHIDRDHVLKSVKDVDHYLHDNDLNVVGLFVDGHNSSAFAKSARHYDDIMFAEAQGTAISTEIADHLARHATLVCETVSIGTSDANSMAVDLPRDNMDCSDTPRNPQRPEWGDTFQASISGRKVTVVRKDEDGGWLQMLALKCCDKDDVNGKKLHDVPVPSIVMFMPHDERFAVYDGDIDDMHTLDKWISARRSPMVARVTQESISKILDNGPEHNPVLFLFANGHDRHLEGVVTEAAKSLRGRVVVATSGVQGQMEKRLMEMAGVDEDQVPVVSLVEAHGGQGGGGGQYHSSKKYRLQTPNLKRDLTAAMVVKFVEDYERKILKPWLRSESEPSAEDMAGDAVQILVGSTFYQSAHDTSKDVMVNFYAPWCGHCRKFEPQYKDIGKKLKHVSTLMVAKMDATRNEVEGMQIMGFPTVALFPAGDAPKHPVMYHGNRQPEDMIKWLHDHCKNKFTETAPAEVTTAEPVSGLLDPSEEDL